MRLTLLALFSLSACVSTVAYADTITFASLAGTTVFTQVSGHGAGDGLTGPAAPYQNPAYGAPIAGSDWVSTNAYGGDGLTSLTDYTEQVTLLPDEDYRGTITFMADDMAGVMVNGVEIYFDPTSVTFYSPTTIALLPSYFHAGVNTITLENYNNFGPAAADYAGTLDGTAVTPEPSSLMLLGTGALSTAAALRRKMRMV